MDPASNSEAFLFFLQAPKNLAYSDDHSSVWSTAASRLSTTVYSAFNIHCPRSENLLHCDDKEPTWRGEAEYRRPRFSC
jgi:hypothetical protein